MRKKKPQKVPYYRIAPSLIPFGDPKWKCRYGSEGCMPLVTSQTLSLARLAPGEAPPPPPPEPTPAQREAQRLAQARQKQLAAQAARQEKEKAKADKTPEEAPIGEEAENLKPFDLQDIPGAMEKMKWPTSAKFARRWFSSPAYIIPGDDTNVGRPMDDTTITLDWALKFGRVRDKYDELLAKRVYDGKKEISDIQKTIKKHIKEIFAHDRHVRGFSTAPFLVDLQQFHNDWKFQSILLSTRDTATAGIVLNDLSGSLGGFFIRAAVGNVLVTSSKYYTYNNADNTKTWCMEPKVHLTHVYVYLHDTYEFNAKPDDRKSQYLGHWNKTGMIVTNMGVISDFERVWLQKFSVHFDKSPAYLNTSGTEYPVDIGGKRHKEEDVFWPVFNSDYNEWRKKHKHGGDFVIFSKPKLVKLKRPIEFTMEKLCAPPEKM
jgi:hypothetical protein